MNTNNLNTVKVLFTDSKYNYETNVSANSTEQTASEYFVNKYFDLGIYPKEDFQKCIGIEFTDNNSMVLQYKLPIDKDLQKGTPVCYKDTNGIFCKVGKIDDIYNDNGVILYTINNAIGAYLANELRLLK